MYTKTTLALLLLACSFSSMAQLEKGHWMTGGIGAFSHSDNNSETGSFKTNIKSTTVGVSADAAYFFVDRFCAGLRPAITHTSHEEQIDGINAGNPLHYSTNAQGTAYSVAPFVRYYFLPKGRKVNILADFSYAYSYARQKIETMQTLIIMGPTFPAPTQSYTVTDTKTKASIYTVSAGPAIILSPNVSLEFTVGYVHFDYWDSDETANQWQMATGFHFHFGKGNPLRLKKTK